MIKLKAKQRITIHPGQSEPHYSASMPIKGLSVSGKALVMRSKLKPSQIYHPKDVSYYKYTVDQMEM